MIEIDGLTKRYGDKTAVDGLSFVVQPGVVTGFLGPNGAGKSTTMRMIAGLDRPTSGTVRVNGKHYPQAPAPMAELGILLDARSVHPGLSARNNLLALARTAGIGRRRVDEVIELAGLGEVAGARAGGFSLGMGQRLGVAAALLGPPETVGLGQLLAAPGVTVINDGTAVLRVSGITAEQIGVAAWRAHLPVYELTPTHASLEEAFMQVTQDSIEYHAGATR